MPYTYTHLSPNDREGMVNARLTALEQEHFRLALRESEATGDPEVVADLTEARTQVEAAIANLRGRPKS